MRCLSLLVFCVVVAVSGASFDVPMDEWRAFKAEYHKKYKSDTEDKLRMKIYAENKQRVFEHNQRYKKKLVSYNVKLNKYADMKQEEYIHTMSGYNSDLKLSKLGGKRRSRRGSNLNPPQEKYPAQMDWRKRGAVTEVKNQGICGACWAFSSTGALEAQLYRKTGKLISLSEQHLVDCSGLHGNRGCDGGFMKPSFDFIKDNGNIATEQSYPYEATRKECRYHPAMKGIDGSSVVGYENIPSGDEKKLMQAVVAVGPVSVAIDASKPGFQFYYDGVYYDPTCSSSQLTHAMLVVGYGTDKVGGDYWLVKNSWGLTWGNKGYIKMARNKKNNCGIATDASYPLVN